MLEVRDRHYAGYLCIHSTTQPQHQGAGYAGKTKPEELLVERKVTGLIPREDVAFSVFNLAIIYAYYVPVV